MKTTHASAAAPTAIPIIAPVESTDDDGGMAGGGDGGGGDGGGGDGNGEVDITDSIKNTFMI